MMDSGADDCFTLPGLAIGEADLRLVAARGTVKAARLHPRFQLLEARTVNVAGQYGEILVVECENDAIPTHPPVDIRYRERLGLWFTDGDTVPSVLALRKSFPSVVHLNQTPEGLPRSLCLYIEPWEATRITWTPRRHLDRVLWWLSETAVGRLHRGDQPLERLFFPFQHQLFLGAEFASLETRPNSRIDVSALSAPDAPRRRFIGCIVDATTPNAGPFVSFMSVDLEAVVHGVHEAYPVTLGQLSDQLSARGANFILAMEEQIRAMSSGHPLPLKSEKGLGLLLVGLSMQRESGRAVERKDYQAFLFEKGIGRLGEAFGWLTRDPDRGFLYTPTILSSGPQSDAWRSLPIDPIEIVEAISADRIRGIAGSVGANGDFAGVLAGVGALGSDLLNLWARQAWGTWTLFDADYMRPHNPIRHEARGDAIGYDKVCVMEVLANAVHATHRVVTQAIPRALHDFAAEETRRALSEATLVVDATTTLDLPRDLSRHDESPRSCSVFFTPRATGSVLMMEDAARTLRLDQIEPQYYRAVIRQHWGKRHLEGNISEYWVGGGCRDLCVAISPEAVQVHSAFISQSLRSAFALPTAALRVWESDNGTGTIQPIDVSLSPSWREQRGGWTVLLDAGLLETAHQIRREHLPRETGGILIGSIDQHRRTIALVDVMPPPADSVGTLDSFERGKLGAPEAVIEANRRTAGIVGYVGEWHSHPPSISTDMSSDDLRQLLHLTMHLGTDGDPSVMLIMADADWSLIVGELTH